MGDGKALPERRRPLISSDVLWSVAGIVAFAIVLAYVLDYFAHREAQGQKRAARHLEAEQARHTA